MRTPAFLFFCLTLIAVTGALTIGSAQERQMGGGVGITVFTDRNFRGKSATFREDVYDLAPLGLNDKISSLRVGRGEQWEICEHSNFGGRCVVVTGSESDLRRNSWNDLISSLRRVRGGGGRPPVPPAPPAQDGPYIVLFDRPNYRGNPTNYNGPWPSTSGNAQSVTIGSGRWELCEGQNYSGNCITLDRSVPNLAAYNMSNRIYSVRPVNSGPLPPPPPTNDWYLVLFDQPNYRGTPRNYNGASSDLGGYNRRAESVTIGRGTWELCEGKNFTGQCITVDRSTPSLGSMIRRIQSIRPLVRQPR